jgi:DNA-binding Lrp family transcriptional regulator
VQRSDDNLVSKRRRIRSQISAYVTVLTILFTRRQHVANAEDAVSRDYSVTGGADVVLFLHLRDMSEYEDLCDRLFREETNVMRFVTMTVIRTAKEETAIAI